MPDPYEGPPVPRREHERLLRQNRALAEQVRALLVLQGIANTLNAELDLPALLREVALAAVRLDEGVVSALFLLDPRGETLVAEALAQAPAPARGPRTRPLGASGAWADATTPALLDAESARRPSARIPLGRGVVGLVAASGVPVLVNDLRGDPRFPPEVIAADAGALGVQPGALLCVPLVFNGQVMGALEVAHSRPDAEFGARDLDLLQTLAAQAATAVTNARLYRDLRQERDRIISAQEDVRKELARALHDGPAQALASLTMQLEYAMRLAEVEPERVRGELRAMQQLALRTTRDIRNLLFDLRPLVLESEGLAPALERFLERFKEAEGPQIHFSAQSTARLPRNAEAITFAVVQEAVNNVLKHARARQCWVEVRERPEALVVVVRDDGVGFDVNQVQGEYERRGSWGLLNMYERAALIEAQLSIRSQPGQGTTVMLTVPLRPPGEGR